MSGVDDIQRYKNRDVKEREIAKTARTSSSSTRATRSCATGRTLALTCRDAGGSTDDPQRRRGYAPIAPQVGRGRVTDVEFDEPALRTEAACRLLEHSTTGDTAARLDLIHQARRMLAAAEALLRREAA